MSGLPHHRRYHRADFTEPKRIRAAVTVLVIVLLAAIGDLGCLVVGIRIGREQQRAADAAHWKKAELDSVKPAYGLRAFVCTKEERREYMEACRQRLRSNLTGGM
jgi:hypothetical protein